MKLISGIGRRYTSAENLGKLLAVRMDSAGLGGQMDQFSMKRSSFFMFVALPEGSLEDRFTPDVATHAGLQ